MPPTTPSGMENNNLLLEQLEHLRSNDSPHCPWLITHTNDSYWIPSQSQSYKFKEFAKTSNFSILKKTLHATHLRKMLDKMCKYEMVPASIVEDTEPARFSPQTDRRTRWNQFNPPSTLLSYGYNYGLAQNRCDSSPSTMECLGTDQSGVGGINYCSIC